MPKQKKQKQEDNPESEIPVSIEPNPHPSVAELFKKVEQLEKDNAMLKAVADKGRVFNYENKTTGKKAMLVSLSVYDGKIIVGWRTLKDTLVKNPTTGLTVGEEQEYELLLMDGEGEIKKMTVNGYPRFSEVRYAERIQVKVVGRKEDENGNFTYTLQLPDGREIELESRFLN